MTGRMGARLRGAAAALAYGALGAAALAFATFAFAFLTGGLDVALGLDWARRVTFVLGSLCMVVGAMGLLFSGGGQSGQDPGPSPAGDQGPLGRAAGMSWPGALIVASVGFLAVGTVAELLYAAVVA